MFGWIARLIEGDALAVAELRTKELQDELKELHETIANFLPRANAISDVLPPMNPNAKGMVLEVEKCRERYVEHMRSAAVRITRFEAGTEEMQKLFALEIAVLRAELERARAFNRIHEQVALVTGGQTYVDDEDDV